MNRDNKLIGILHNGMKTCQFFPSLVKLFVPVSERKIKRYRTNGDLSLENENDKIIDEMIRRFNHLISFLENLALVSVYFDSSISRRICEISNLKESEYYCYHYEYFLIRLVSLLDLCSNFGNLLFKIDKKKQNLNWYQFTQHKLLRKHKCSIILNQFAYFLQTQKNDRNAIVHEGGFENITIKGIKSKFIDLSFMEIDTQLVRIFENIKSEEISNLNETVSYTYEKCIEYVFSFLNSLNDDLISKYGVTE